MSGAFAPTPDDGGKLSVDSGELVSAEEAHQQYVGEGRSSDGCMSLLVGEMTERGYPVDNDRIPFPSHCVIDVRDVQGAPPSRGAAKKIGKTLRNLAIQRGWEFRVECEEVGEPGSVDASVQSGYPSTTPASPPSSTPSASE